MRYQERLTAYSDITASSDFGIKGNVGIFTLQIDPGETLTTLPANTLNAQTQIKDSCEKLPVASTNQFK